MGYVIALLNQKGGVGKTTLSVNLARGLQLGGYKVLLVDSDPQGSARMWRESQDTEDTPPVVGGDSTKLDSDLKVITPAFDYTIIDGLPGVKQEPNAVTLACIRAADLVLIPIAPSPVDIWTCRQLVHSIKERQNVNEGKPLAAFVVNRQTTGSRLAAEIDSALKTYGFPVLKSRTANRVIYADSLGAGFSVLDLEPRGRAAKEIRAIISEIDSLL